MDVGKVCNAREETVKASINEDLFDAKARFDRIAAPASRLVSKLKGKGKDTPNSSPVISSPAPPELTAQGSGSGSSHIGPPSLSNNATATTDDLYAFSCLVPGQTKRVYPFAPIKSEKWSADEYLERFQYVIGELKKAVDADYELRHRSKFINYDFCMVGTSPQTALPSVMIYCRSSDIKALRILFQKRGKDRLYCHQGSRWSQLFRNATPSKPPFRLVYCKTFHDPTLIHASDEALEVWKPSDSTFCGSLIKCRGRVATIALTLEIDGVDRLLTVEHVCNNQTQWDHHDTTDILSFISVGCGSDQATLNSADMVSLGPLWVDDEDDGFTQPITTYRSQAHSTATEIATSKKEQASATLHANRVVPQRQLNFSDPHLDWLLLETDTKATHARRRNLIFPGGSLSPILLYRFSEKPQAHATPVFMVSGVRGLQTGRLLDRFSYLGSRPGQALGQAWTMIPDNSSGILPGECGSVVVDQATFEVYGHVLGSNGFGHAYIIPLYQTMNQIKISFLAQTISLPQSTYNQVGEEDISPTASAKKESEGQPGSELLPSLAAASTEFPIHIGSFKTNPLSEAPSVASLISDALMYSADLRTTICSFQTQDKEARALKSELGHLTAALKSLMATFSNDPDIDFDTLKPLLHRCGKVCKEYSGLIIQFTGRYSGSRSRSQDWVTQQYLQGDVIKFNDMLAGYNATLNIALANANMPFGAIPLKVLEDYKYMIWEATYDLKEHYRSLDSKIESLTHEEVKIWDHGIEWQALMEKQSNTQRGLEMCAQLSTTIEQLDPTATAYSQLVYQNSAHKHTKNDLDATKSSLQAVISQLQNHKDNIGKQMDSILWKDPLSNDTTTKFKRLQETKESIYQCIEIVSDAENTLAAKPYTILEDITVAEDACNLTISTVGDPITARRINLMGRSCHIGGQISDEAYRKTTAAFAREGIMNVKQFTHDIEREVSTPSAETRNLG